MTGLLSLLITLLLPLAAEAGPIDYYQVSGASPALETASAFRDLSFGADEYAVAAGAPVSQPNDDHCCVFSPDGRLLWIQTAQTATPQQGGGGLARINRFDAATGARLGEIPIDSRWPQNPLNPALAQFGLKADRADGLAASAKYLGVLVRAGEQPRRWLPALYDAATGKLVKTLPLIAGTGKSLPHNLLFSDDGRYLVFEHDLPRSLYTFDIASGRAKKANLDFLLDRQGLKACASPLYPLPGGQVALIAARQQDEARRLVILDLDASEIVQVLGEGFEFDTRFEQKSAFDSRGQLLIGPLRAQGDQDKASRCADGAPCLRLAKFPSLTALIRFQLKTQAGAPILSYFSAENTRMALSEADPRLLVVGSGTPADADYAMLIDTLDQGHILSWVKLPVRHGSWFRIGPRRDGGYWVLADQPPPGTGLRLFRF